MKCRKQLVLSGYRVQFVDLREPKPRTPREEIYTAERQWLDAMALTGQNVIANIRERYEKAGYKVFSVEAITPKRIAEIDLNRLWIQTAPPASADHGEADE